MLSLRKDGPGEVISPSSSETASNIESSVSFLFSSMISREFLVDLVFKTGDIFFNSGAIFVALIKGEALFR
jgi:hypothetical protein